MPEYTNGRLIAVTGPGAAGWVRVKVKIHVPFNTDLNKMRKAIKKAAEAMQADPELGPTFLQPPKSRGAVDTDESGFITSVTARG